MKGIVLCGGGSTRMGDDKGTMPLYEKNWAQTMANKFTALGIPYTISINEKQKDVYEKAFDQQQIIIDDATTNAKGPLLGLLSVHKYFPEDDLFVLACDMIDMDLPPLQLLLNKRLQHGDYDAYLFKTNNDLQPLCTIFTAEYLNKVSVKLQQGELKRFSLKYVLGLGNNYVEKIPAKWFYFFNNYNSPNDLNALNTQT